MNDTMETSSTRFNTWLNNLDDLSLAPYQWITQIAYELADGLTKGFWNTLIARQMMGGWEPHIGLEEYVANREKQSVFNGVSVEYDRRRFGLIVESLVLADFLDRTRLSSGNRAWLTSKAFELLQPDSMER